MSWKFTLACRELRIHLGMWLLRKWLPFSLNVDNEIGCTVAVVLCEDRETFDQRFNIVPRYHTDTPKEAVH